MCVRRNGRPILNKGESRCAGFLVREPADIVDRAGGRNDCYAAVSGGGARGQFYRKGVIFAFRAACQEPRMEVAVVARNAEHRGDSGNADRRADEEKNTEQSFAAPVGG